MYNTYTKIIQETSRDAPRTSISRFASTRIVTEFSSGNIVTYKNPKAIAHTSTTTIILTIICQSFRNFFIRSVIKNFNLHIYSLLLLTISYLTFSMSHLCDPTGNLLQLNYTPPRIIGLGTASLCSLLLAHTPAFSSPRTQNILRAVCSHSRCSCDPTGNRTPIYAVKGRCPSL